MKKFRKTISKWQIITPIVCIFIFFSCYNDDETAIVKKEYSGEELFRGIFFLEGEVAQNLESLKPNLDEMEKTLRTNPEAQGYYNDFANEILKQIQILDPGFLDSFKEQIKSDNYYSIELALGNGFRMIKAAGFASEKYAGIFKLMSEVQEKNVDFDSKEFEKLDLKNPEDIEKLKTILKENYAIDVEDDQYAIPCVPFAGFCIYYAVAGVVSIAAAAYALVAAGQAIYIAVYVWKVEVWGGINSSNNIAKSDLLISEIANLF